MHRRSRGVCGPAVYPDVPSSAVPPPGLVIRIADRFDAELRTGRHDALFDP